MLICTYHGYGRRKVGAALVEMCIRDRFSGEIRYSDGTLLCEEGQTLTDEEIWQINKEVEGVTATSN